MARRESLANAEDLLTVGIAEEADLEELAQIAAFNFENSRNYQGLPRHVVARFIERNSVENLRVKLRSGRHRIVVARERGRPVGFCITKMLSDNCAMGTRLHVSPRTGAVRVAPAIHRFLVDRLREDGCELLYGEVSGDGHGLKAFLRAGFLYVDSYGNRLIPSARIDRVVQDLLASNGQSAYVPLLTPGSTYGSFVEAYGLVIERLMKKIERMHLTGNSRITQSVFSHVENGLMVIRDLREQLGQTFAASIQWNDVETMWIFHDIGEIGMDNDIPSYKKTRLARLAEEQKVDRILEHVRPRDLRSALAQSHARYAQRKARAAGAPPAEIDKEAALCAFVDKLEAAEFIGRSGIGEVWKRRVGRWVFQWIARRHALGAFIEPLDHLRPFLDEPARIHLFNRLTGIVRGYHERGLVSKRFLEERTSVIARALGYEA